MTSLPVLVQDRVSSAPPGIESSSSAPSGRDTALDAVRGYAIVAMFASHVGPLTEFTAAIHLPVYLSAAEPFIVASGIVLGTRAAREPVDCMPKAFYVRVLRRAWTLLRIHYALTLFVLVLHQTWGVLGAPSVQAAGGWLRALGLVLTLQLQPLDFMNILPLYVLFVGTAPITLELARRGFGGGVAVLSAGLWVVAQSRPSLVPIPDPRINPVVFSVVAWQFAFTLGLLFGFYRKRLPNPSRSFKLAVQGIAGVLFVLAQFQRRSLRWVGLVLPGHLGFLVQKSTWGPLRALYSVCLIVALHEAFRRFLAYSARTQPSSGVSRWALRVVEELQRIGGRSLYCFLLHLFFALGASALAVGLWPRWSQELVVPLSLAVFLVMTARNVGARLVPD